MRSVFSLIIILGFSLALAQSSAWAIDVPCPPYCTIEWHDLGCGGTTVLVCPSGDGAWLRVRVLDTSKRPMVGQIVTASLESGCNTYLCSPIRGVTGSDGWGNLRIRAGLDASGGPACCTVRTRLFCCGVPLYDSERIWLSPDLGGNGAVGEPDRAIFLTDLPSSACRSDFDCDGLVGQSDYEIFLAHLGHSCVPISLEGLTWGSVKALYR